jgi:hypothetical protein
MRLAGGAKSDHVNKSGGSMKLSVKQVLGYANFAVGLLCLLSWFMNSLGWIRLGDPVGQLIMVPVCFGLGTLLLEKTAQTK